MSTVGDTQRCPQCQGQAQTEFGTHTGELRVFCLRCGFSSLNSYRDPGKDWRTAGVGTVTSGGKCVTRTDLLHVPESAPLIREDIRARLARGEPMPEVLAVRCPPHYRTEYLRGHPGQPLEAFFTPREIRHLHVALDHLGDQPYLATAGKVFLRHPDHPGDRVMHYWREDGTLLLSHAEGEPPTVTIRGGRIDKAMPCGGTSLA